LNRLVHRLGALGWTIAHIGAVRGLIFVPSCVPDHAVQALPGAGLRGVFFAVQHLGFQTPEEVFYNEIQRSGVALQI
jgi:hypothetical protein